MLGGYEETYSRYYTNALDQWYLRKLSVIELYHHVQNDMAWTLGNHTLLLLSKARHFSPFGHTAQIPDETDAKILSWRTEGDHQDAFILLVSSRTWNPITSPWMQQLTWLRIVLSGKWRLQLALQTPSDAHQKWMSSWLGHCKSSLGSFNEGRLSAKQPTTFRPSQPIYTHLYQLLPFY